MQSEIWHKINILGKRNVSYSLQYQQKAAKNKFILTISYILIRIYRVLSARLAVCETRRMKTRLSKANLRQDGSIEDIDFRHPSGLDKSLVLRLSDGQWIIDHNILIITGPTGAGKSQGKFILGVTPYSSIIEDLRSI
jgi:DNA replication protein DnaC